MGVRRACIYQQRYPWGNEPPTSTRLNAAGEETPGDWTRMPGFGNDGWPQTAPVGSFPATRPPGVFFDDEPNAGLRDMAGNVWEWVVDGYVDYPTNGATVPVDPVTVDGSSRVHRGGSWSSDGPSWGRAALRSYFTPAFRLDSVGGRCSLGGR